MQQDGVDLQYKSLGKQWDFSVASSNLYYSIPFIIIHSLFSILFYLFHFYSILFTGMELFPFFPLFSYS